MRLEELAWHAAVGRLIHVLDKTDFWTMLTRLLGNYVQFDSWVVLKFSPEDRPLVVAEIQPDDAALDPLFQNYLQGLYVLDPFFIAACESTRDEFVRLDDVAPECFKATEYYEQYFRRNIVEDEIQFNCFLNAGSVLSLSLGSHKKFSPEETTLLSLISQWVIPLLRQRWQHELRLPENVVIRKPPKPGSLDHNLARFNNTSLSERELEISRFILSGCSSKEIARKLNISAETVKSHRKHLYSKLRINSQSELFAIFLHDRQITQSSP